MAGHKGRGRLSAIDLLPEEAEPDVVWVVAELQKGDRLQKDILEEFNSRLADRGVGSISKSAFNRFSVRKAMAFRRMNEVREISNALTRALGPDSSDNLTIMIAETIKTLIFEIMEGGKEISTKGAMELSRALKHSVEALSISTEHKRRVEEDFKRRVTKAIDKSAKARGLKSDTVAAIKADILGIDPVEPALSEGGADAA